MGRLGALELFSRIVELGSFSRAAATLEIPRATATHAIKELEARLGTRLLDRTTRSVRPTLDGQAFYERCVHVLSELDDAEASLRHVASSPRGVLRVDMHGTHATAIVLPRIDEFRARYPPCPTFPLSALYPYHRQLSPRVRVFIDWLTQLYEEKFGPLPGAPSL
jgi:DNA-binding transcriptional LysR family regulator